jgi:hypothetical protein
LLATFFTDDAKVVEKREGQDKGTIEYYMHYIGCKNILKNILNCYMFADDCC